MGKSQGKNRTKTWVLLVSNFKSIEKREYRRTWKWIGKAGESRENVDKCDTFALYPMICSKHIFVIEMMIDE